MLVFKRKEQYNCYSVWFGGIEVGEIYEHRGQFSVRCFDKAVYNHVFDYDGQMSNEEKLKKAAEVIKQNLPDYIIVVEHNHTEVIL